MARMCKEHGEMRGENMARAYIHQGPDWPKSIWDCKRFSPLLSGVNLRQGLLLGWTRGYARREGHPPRE